ncbi:hypothetical protein FIE12Z_3983 [Fusarium flagelliforme]|uniref:Uncharacterized protein n=1 Tax=Fusarium flagelliforme TaxID=2675880 RepID=A0A395MVK9_9HYPO|nr:hypothetical protein FIE12Z_3983 [Fusarium flagelliforme]
MVLNSDVRLSVHDGIPTADALHVVSAKQKIILRHVQDGGTTNDNTVNEVELTNLPWCLSVGASVTNVTLVTGDVMDKMVKAAITDEPFLFSRAGSRNKDITMIQREKASLKFQMQGKPREFVKELE